MVNSSLYHPNKAKDPTTARKENRGPLIILKGYQIVELFKTLETSITQQAIPNGLETRTKRRTEFRANYTYEGSINVYLTKHIHY